MLRSLLLGSLLVVATTGVASTARAEDRLLDPTPQKLEERETEAHWYGWQVMLADAATIGVTIASQNPYVFAGSYLIGAPVVHAVHERGGASVASLGLRVALPVVGGMLGSAAARCGHPNGDADFCGFGEVIVGFGAGLLLASAIDAAALSWETVPKKPESKLSLTPSFTPTKTGPLFGLSGTF
jgi:hypothetical protein